MYVTQAYLQILCLKRGNVSFLLLITVKCQYIKVYHLVTSIQTSCLQDIVPLHPEGGPSRATAQLSAPGSPFMCIQELSSYFLFAFPRG